MYPYKSQSGSFLYLLILTNSSRCFRLTKKLFPLKRVNDNLYKGVDSNVRIDSGTFFNALPE
jgi:hypothetical protein